MREAGISTAQILHVSLANSLQCKQGLPLKLETTKHALRDVTIVPEKTCLLTQLHMLTPNIYNRGDSASIIYAPKQHSGGGGRGGGWGSTVEH